MKPCSRGNGSEYIHNYAGSFSLASSRMPSLQMTLSRQLLIPQLILSNESFTLYHPSNSRFFHAAICKPHFTLPLPLDLNLIPSPLIPRYSLLNLQSPFFSFLCMLSFECSSYVPCLLWQSLIVILRCHFRHYNPQAMLTSVRCQIMSTYEKWDGCSFLIF